MLFALVLALAFALPLDFVLALGFAVPTSFAGLFVRDFAVVSSTGVPSTLPMPAFEVSALSVDIAAATAIAVGGVVASRA